MTDKDKRLTEIKERIQEDKPDLIGTGTQVQPKPIERVPTFKTYLNESVRQTTKTFTTEKTLSIDPLSGTATIETAPNKQMRITDYLKSGGLDYRPSTSKVLLLALEEFTKNNSYAKDIKDVDPAKLNKKVIIPLDYLMDRTGKKQSMKDKTRKTFKNDLDVLSRMQLQYEEKNDNKVIRATNLNIFQRTDYSNSAGALTFTEDIAKYLCVTYVTELPDWILKLDERQENTYSLAIYLINYYTLSRNVVRKTPTNNIISVKKLLENSPNIPTIDSVIKSRNSPYWKIIKPLEEALDKMGDHIQWAYCKAKSEPLDLADESNNYNGKDDSKLTNYDDWIKLYINFEFPEMAGVIDNIKATSQQKAKKREENAKRYNQKNKAKK